MSWSSFLRRKQGELPSAEVFLRAILMPLEDDRSEQDEGKMGGLLAEDDPGLVTLPGLALPLLLLPLCLMHDNTKSEERRLDEDEAPSEEVDEDGECFLGLPGQRSKESETTPAEEGGATVEDEDDSVLSGPQPPELRAE